MFSKMKKKAGSVILFALIFILYFSSSVGLINSGDTPQYFTTEGLMRYASPDLTPFTKDPHFFIWPDSFDYKGNILSFRGYALSLLAMPFHIIARYIYPLFTWNNFPSVVVTPHFTYELAVVSLFTLFSVFGLMIMRVLMKNITRSSIIADTVTFFLATGTYIWKYSVFYTRGAVMVFFLSAVSLCFWNILKEKRRQDFNYYILLFLWACSYGIDLILFVSITLAVMLLMVLEKKKTLLRAKKPLVAGLFVLAILIIGNYRWYGNASSNQTLQSTYYFGNLPMQERVKVVASSPILPSVWAVLFNFGSLASSIFDHFKHIPSYITSHISLEFAKKYRFFGIFAISPFLLFSFIKIRLKDKATKSLCMILMTLFIVNLLGNASFFTFWGGNQYDIRYFYPFVVLFGVPVALSLKHITGIKNFFYKCMGLLLFFLLSFFSVLMGWLGVINMFAPALTGERKIWMDVIDLPLYYSRFSFDQYVNATFMNRENAWIAALIFLILLLFWGAIEYTWHKTHYVSKEQ